MIKLLLKTGTNNLNQTELSGLEINIYKGKGTAQGKIVVVGSAINGNSAVANNIEDIALQVITRHKLDPENLIFIEHRRAQINFEETYDLVHLEWHPRRKQFTKPAWSHFTKKATEAITGELINERRRRTAKHRFTK